MILKRITFALLVAASCTFAASLQAESTDSSVDELKQQSQELGETLQDYGADQKDQAEDAINRTLTALDKRIAELEDELSENWDDMSNAARERSQESLASLREQRERVQTWYNELKASSASAWERAKKGFSDAYDALSDQWNKTERDLTLDQDKKAKSI
jgi:DNA anti-recombination protein RmuC|tara:strand:- start:1333 stop:1809 length:477 start_codon:yes stop_codon:yes gene_type:complete